MKQLTKMSKEEKKIFLSMDLIERLIRLEQRVSASFGKFIPDYKTKYFKKLPKEEKKEFARYLKKNKRKKYLLGCSLLFLVGGAIFFRGILITSRIIESSSKIENNFFTYLILACLLVFVLIVVLSLLSYRKREKRIKGHFDVIDNLYMRKLKKITF